MKFWAATVCIVGYLTLYLSLLLYLVVAATHWNSESLFLDSHTICKSYCVSLLVIARYVSFSAMITAWCSFRLTTKRSIWPLQWDTSSCPPIQDDKRYIARRKTNKYTGEWIPVNLDNTTSHHSRSGNIVAPEHIPLTDCTSEVPPDCGNLGKQRLAKADCSTCISKKSL